LSHRLPQPSQFDHTPVYPREVVKRALELSATAVILVHKRPTRNPTHGPLSAVKETFLRSLLTVRI